MHLAIPLSWWVQELDKVHCKPLWCNLKPKELLAFGGECILLCWWSTHPGCRVKCSRGASEGSFGWKKIRGAVWVDPWRAAGETRLASGSSSVERHETAQMVCREVSDCKPRLWRSITFRLQTWSVERYHYQPAHMVCGEGGLYFDHRQECN